MKIPLKFIFLVGGVGGSTWGVGNTKSSVPCAVTHPPSSFSLNPAGAPSTKPKQIEHPNGLLQCQKSCRKPSQVPQLTWLWVGSTKGLYPGNWDAETNCQNCEMQKCSLKVEKGAHNWSGNLTTENQSNSWKQNHFMKTVHNNQIPS